MHVDYLIRRYRDMKCLKLVLALASGLVALAAAICAIVIFQEEITKWLSGCKAACCKALRLSKKEESDEYADFADV